MKRFRVFVQDVGRAGYRALDEVSAENPVDALPGRWQVGKVGYPVETRKSKRGALSWAKSWQQPGDEIIVRENPYDDAASLSEAFHGRPAQSITEYTDSLHEHTVLTDLGALLRINLDHGIKIKFPRSQTRLASNEAGTQLYAVGGDQSVDLDGFDADESKHHLGEEDKTEGPYVHELGDETGHLPILVYDTVNRLLSFVGGSYHIDIDMDGKYSAGIRD